MKKLIPTLLLLIWLFPFLAYPVKGEPILHTLPIKPMTVFQLLEKQAELDGKEIVFQGEAIGQPIFEKNGVFLNVMDLEFNALGIYLEKASLSKITHFGRDGIKGDILSIAGIFHKVCIQHGGDTDLHATNISILKPGSVLPSRAIPLQKIFWSFLLPLIVIILYYLSKKKTRTP